MRVLHCIPSMEGGGAERQLAYLAGELVRQGCAVDVALTRGGANLDRLEASGARIHDLGPCRSHDPRLLVRLGRTLASVKPDLVQCWLLQMEVLGGVASLMAGVPWLLSERSSAGAYPLSAKHCLRRGAASLASGIVANSAAGDDYWSRRLRKSQPRYIIRNGLPLEEIASAPVADLRQELGITGPAILFAGRFDDGKNAATLIEALGLMRSTVPAVLCGDGPGRRQIERLVSDRGLHTRVRILGFAPNLWSVLKSGSALASPSRFEGSPNVVLEAMACECPLVVSDIPAHREILDADCAVFVEPDDPVALAQALDGVVTNPEAARTRAARAAARAERHTVAAVAQQYLRVYQDVLHRRAVARGRVTT